MAPDQHALLDLLGELKLIDIPDRIRVATEALYQALIEAEATAFIGAAPFERSDARTTHRNWGRQRTLTTTAGDLELRIPKLQGSFFPSLLGRRRRVDQALFAVVREAYLHGVSTPKVAAMLEAARDDMTAFRTFPTAHWRQIWSTNPLERVNKEIKRRTAVVGVFPNPAALLRLAGAVLIEQHDEWDAADRRYFSEQSMNQLDTTIQEVAIPEFSAA